MGEGSLGDLGAENAGKVLKVYGLWLVVVKGRIGEVDSLIKEDFWEFISGIIGSY